MGIALLVDHSDQQNAILLNFVLLTALIVQRHEIQQNLHHGIIWQPLQTPSDNVSYRAKNWANSSRKR